MQRCAASLGGLLKKNGARSSQKKPCQLVNPPFDPDVCVDGHWPQLTQRMACDHRHDPEYEEGHKVSVRRTAKTPQQRNKTTMGESICNSVVAVFYNCIAYTFVNNVILHHREWRGSVLLMIALQP